MFTQQGLRQCQFGEIKATYFTSEYVQQLKTKMSSGQFSKNWTVQDDLLMYKGRTVLDPKYEMIHLNIAGFHNGTVEGYLNRVKRISVVFYWQGMSKQMFEFLQSCDICLKNKSLHRSPAGLLQPLSVPHHVQTHISMDFITHLPVSKELDCIFVVVDCVTKTAHFIPLKHPYTAQTVAQLFFDNVFKLYGMPVCIVCDRDPTFASGYWKEMFELQ